MEELYLKGTESAKQLIESRGRAPVLGWADNRSRRDPIDLLSTDIRKTFDRVQRAIKRNTVREA
jgi:hypothetical protein